MTSRTLIVACLVIAAFAIIGSSANGATVAKHFNATRVMEIFGSKSSSSVGQKNITLGMGSTCPSTIKLASGGVVDPSQIPTATQMSMPTMLDGTQSDAYWSFSLCAPDGGGSFVVVQIPTGMGPGITETYSLMTAPPEASTEHSDELVFMYSGSKGGTITVRVRCQKGVNGLQSSGAATLTSQSSTAHLQSDALCPVHHAVSPSPGGHGSTPSGGKASGGLTGGGVFLLVVFLSAFTYVAGFMSFNYYKKEKRGREMLPHTEFWSEVPGYVAEGCKVTYVAIATKVREYRAGSGSGDYQAV